MKSKTTAEGLEKGVRVRSVVGFEGYYEVTDDGCVWSVPRVIMRSNGRPKTVAGRWLRSFISRQGYRFVWLQVEGARKFGKIHVLVARAFYGPLPDGFVTDHKDRDQLNNRASNLRYVTQSVNMHNISAKGFYRDKDAGRYRAQVKVGGRKKHLGSFGNEEEARAAYIAAKKLHGVYTP